MLAALAALLVTACSVQSDLSGIERTAPRPVILDVDMAHGNMTAALFLLQHPNVEVRALTVAGTGKAHCGPGVAHALGLLRLVDGADIPVACGPEIPEPGGHSFPATWRADADRAYGLVPEIGEFPLSFPNEEYPSMRSIKGLLASVHNQTIAYLEKLDDDELRHEFEAQWGETRLLVDFIAYVI
jgi:hypothetical protein